MEKRGKEGIGGCLSCGFPVWWGGAEQEPCPADTTAMVYVAWVSPQHGTEAVLADLRRSLAGLGQLQSLTVVAASAAEASDPHLAVLASQLADACDLQRAKAGWMDDEGAASIPTHVELVPDLAPLCPILPSVSTMPTASRLACPLGHRPDATQEALLALLRASNLSVDTYTAGPPALHSLAAALRSASPANGRKAALVLLDRGLDLVLPLSHNLVAGDVLFRRLSPQSSGSSDRTVGAALTGRLSGSLH